MTPDWIAVDWGTSHLRAWALSASDTVLWSGQSGDGIGQLSGNRFEPALIALIGDVLGASRCDVLACGMIGSRQGWVEAGYEVVPCTPNALQATLAESRDPRISVRVIGGVKQTSPPDVMRGEETQIAGFLSLNKDFDGVVCLPGTHTKWAHISAGEIVSFKTFMTGELFACISNDSVLRHSVDENADAWDADAFDRAVSETLSRPERLAGALFSIRAEHLLQGAAPEKARATLSGLLVGAELAAARPYWLGQHVAVVGAERLSQAYRAALEAQGAAVTIAQAEHMTLAGLRAARKKLRETAG
ncbi:MAG: 2-dehydro-3-deoxygalactonokinase [Pseudomonadota bacterium]